MNVEKNVEDFWTSLASVRADGALKLDWQWRFGEWFGVIERFLRPTARQSETCPCKSVPACDCRHRVQEIGSGLMAVCSCGDSECSAFQVEPENLLIHALDWPRLGEALCRPLGFMRQEGPGYARTALRQIGLYASVQAPVLFGLGDPDLLLREAQRFLQRHAGPCILITATGGARGQELDSLLKHHSGIHITASSQFTVELDGAFGARVGVQKLLAAFECRVAAVRATGVTALQEIKQELSAMRSGLSGLSKPEASEPVPEDAARRALALLQQLDAESPMRPPTILTVFRFYCNESLSADQIARKCRCSKGTVIGRLRLIRAKTGVDPAALRRFSPQFQKIEEDISDARARRIRRTRLVDDIEAENSAD